MLDSVIISVPTHNNQKEDGRERGHWAAVERRDSEFEPLGRYKGAPR